MTNNDPLQTAATHLAAARRLGTELASKSLFSRLRRKNAKNVNQVVHELAAAIDLITSVTTETIKRTEQLEAQSRLLDQSVARLEVVTAGDEQLIDYLGAAIEAAQIALVRLERQQDLLRRQLAQR